MRWATDVAGVSRDIVLRTAMTIQGRKYVKVEGWQAIAVAHGCVASARSVEKVEGGYRAIGEVKRMSDGAILSTAEGFIGEDEATWFGGQVRGGKVLEKRPDYAIRAMCQTRAISRACRSAFAHVVVLIDSKLSTTPAEEVPDGGFVDVEATPQQPKPTPKPDPTKSATSVGAPAANGENTIVECQFVDYHEAHSKPEAQKQWTAWFCKFDHQGQVFEAGTFDKKIGESLDVLKGGVVRLEYKPGKKPGTYEIVSVEPADLIP